jgi:isopentenyl-diphosphate delta-isomerase
MNVEETLILVDEDDNEVGFGEKLEVHRMGLLHRGFSVFVFNPDGKLFLQKRAMSKYHSGGLWSNTCCGHPRPREEVEAAGRRRLMEEMGFDCDLNEVHQFIYRTEFDNDLIEHEFIHVLIGGFDGKPEPNPIEVGDWKLIDTDWVEKDIETRPHRYSYWFRFCFDQVIGLWKNH